MILVEPHISSSAPAIQVDASFEMNELFRFPVFCEIKLISVKFLEILCSKTGLSLLFMVTKLISPESYMFSYEIEFIIVKVLHDSCGTLHLSLSFTLIMYST